MGFEEKLGLVTLIIIILLVGGGIYLCTLGYQNKQIYQCEVKEKWVKSSGNSQKYNVKCGDTIYEITDLLFKGKFNSSDIYGALEVGKKYEIETTGYRIPFLSDYQNINKYKELVE